jgi:two-component system chemotaxis response regulator CheB
MSGPTRVLVVDDSLTVRKRLIEILADHPDFEVAGEASDGKQAIELCRALRPDVITLDMMLPIMTGLAVTEYIMAHQPTPILVVSASTNRGELFKTYDALAAGAVDVLDKPRGEGVDQSWEERFVSTLRLVSRIRVITHPRGRLGAMGRAGVTLAGMSAAGGADRFQLCAIGASTGGPAALIEVLRAIPAPCPVPLLIVVHINEIFGSAFADWLGQQTPHPVAYPQDGQPLSAFVGRVALAVPGQHLVVQGERLRLDPGPERHSCRPSVDLLFQSLARDRGPTTVAALLTGMGRDGAAGLLDLRRAGALTIAQDEATSVVYGMPREAALLGAAERVLPLSQIGPAIDAAVGRRVSA